MHTYRNPWHQGDKGEYGPTMYECASDPVDYGGYQIFHRSGLVWDVVKDGQCLTQRAGPSGARRYIDGVVAALKVEAK